MAAPPPTAGAVMVAKDAPVPSFVTVSANVFTNDAFIVLFALIVTLHVLAVGVLVQPVELSSRWPGPALAVSATTVPLGKVSLQSPGQTMPAGLLVTVEPLAPRSVTVNETGAPVANWRR